MEDHVNKLFPPGFSMDLSAARMAAIAVLFAVAVLSPDAFAQVGDGSPDRLKVGAVPAPPYAMRAEGGEWEGLSVDLWQAIASAIGARYEIQEYGSFEQLADAAAEGELDVAIGLAATQQRESLLDLTHPYYRSGLAIAVTAESFSHGWFGFFKRIKIGSILEAVFFLVLLWLIAAVAVSVFERRRNHEMFGGGILKGLGHAVWWAAVTMTTVGYGDKAPKTLGGRIVAIVWMLVSIMLIAGFTGTISATLTAEKLTGKVRGFQDLPYVRVGSVYRSEPERWLVDHGISPTLFSTSKDGLQAIIDKQIDAFVFDEIVLRHLVKVGFTGRVHVLAETFNNYFTCIGLPIGSPLRKPINKVLLQLMETNQWKKIVERYIGPRE